MGPGRLFHGCSTLTSFPQHTWNAGFRTRQKFRQKRFVRSHTSSSISGLASQRREGRVANGGWGRRDRDRAGRTIQTRHFPQTSIHTLYILLPPSPLEALPGAPPAAPPTPVGRSSSATRPARPAPLSRPLKPPRRAARRTRRSWTNQKYGFRTKAKALTALPSSGRFWGAA